VVVAVAMPAKASAVAKDRLARSGDVAFIHENGSTRPRGPARALVRIHRERTLSEVRSASYSFGMQLRRAPCVRFARSPFLRAGLVGARYTARAKRGYRQPYQ
jgi:hypothetical protein